MTEPLFNSLFTFLPPWIPVGNHAKDLERELYREVAAGHPLYKKKVHAIAQRTDCDDVLFEVSSSDFRCVVVHLTWSQRAEHEPRWPEIEVFTTFQKWVEGREAKSDDT
jgi:hypothetical protein